MSDGQQILQRVDKHVATIRQDLKQLHELAISQEGELRDVINAVIAETLHHELERSVEVRRRSLSLEDRKRELRNRHRMRVEAAGPHRAEEARQVAANRRVISGEVTEYDASTRTATVQLPGGETIRGRTIGRGAPIGKVVVTIPMGSAIATIQAPEPRC